MTPERAAELTMYCHVEYDHKAPPDKRYWARYWHESRNHYGSGPTALSAVIAAYRAAGRNPCA